jgi:hypothetical protein
MEFERGETEQKGRERKSFLASGSWASCGGAWKEARCGNDVPALLTVLYRGVAWFAKRSNQIDGNTLYSSD